MKLQELIAYLFDSAAAAEEEEEEETPAPRRGRREEGGEEEEEAWLHHTIHKSCSLALSLSLCPHRRWRGENKSLAGSFMG